MNVKKLIKILQMCDPEAEVHIEARNTNDVCEIAEYESLESWQSGKLLVYIGDTLTHISDENRYSKLMLYHEINDLPGALNTSNNRR